MYNLNILQQLKYSPTIHSACGFVSGNIYEVTITEAPTAGYIILSKYNVTEDRDVDIQIYLSSEKSVMRYFCEI